MYLARQYIAQTGALLSICARSPLLPLYSFPRSVHAVRMLFVCARSPLVPFFPSHFLSMPYVRSQFALAPHLCLSFPFLSILWYVCSSVPKVALCVMIDSIATEDARVRPSRGLSPRPKAEQVRILLAAGTNVAVDR